jgi:hypothetical protein
MEWELAGETEVLAGNLPQCHFVHMTWSEIEPGKPASYGTPIAHFRNVASVEL